MMMMMMKWGTWEELVLGGAVLRHGTRAWDAVASELRARTLYPYVFTPKECKAKYEDLQERYSGCNAWFEELRKQRVAELRRELEKSEDSIGSLQSKLESLKAVKEDSNVEYDSSQTESLVPPGNTEGVESSGKEMTKDEPSAGSFTEETRRDWSPEPQIPVAESAKENETKAEFLEDSEREKTSCGNPEVSRGSVKKRRGKRKRKECKEVKEGSVGESDVMSSANVVASRGREEHSGGCERNVQVSCEESGGARKEEEAVDLARMLDSIMEHDDVSLFRRRLESQRRARYNKLIRRHMDLDTIRSRIEDGSICSSKQLYRDLLLLSNNALVFYPKDSKEHKSALSLRNSASKIFQQKPKDSSIHDSSEDVKLAGHVRNPVKPRSVRPCNHKIAGKVVIPGIPKLSPKLESKKGCSANVPPKKVVIPGPPKLEGKKGCSANVPPVIKSSGRPAKGAQESGQKQIEVPAKGRKRARRR